MNWLAIIAAWGLDLAFKDPQFSRHPVRLIGRWIGAQESVYRRRIANELLGGFLLSGVTVAVVWAAAFGLAGVASRIHPLLGFLVNTALIYFSISPAALSDEGANIHRLLAEGKDQEAREALSLIVGRDTGNMKREDVERACIETMAENSVDALVSPLFFAALGGGPLAMAFKAVNTCDSMVGYRNEKYEKFGKVAARLDDSANFIPARLSIPLVVAAARLTGLDAREAWRIGLRDRLKHPSPNSAHGEAAFAGALGVRFGGISSYGGVRKEKPWLGDNPRPLELEDVKKGVSLLRATAFVAVFFFAFAAFIIK